MTGKLGIEVVTPDGRVSRGHADFVLARGTEGDLGILPGHVPLMTCLAVGRLLIRNDGAEEDLVVAGGFLMVLPDRVTVVADVAERVEDVATLRAQEARLRAAQAMREPAAGVEAARTLERELTRARVERLPRRRRRRGGGEPPGGDSG